jgi:hypothetical protein
VDNRSRVNFRFVVQPGSLALRARFLAGSLRRFAPGDSVLEACIPSGYAEIDANTLKAFDHLGVVTSRFAPEISRRYNYPIGNKVDAACLPGETDRVVLLDSDIIAIRPFETAELEAVTLGMRPIMARQVFVAERRQMIDRFVGKNVRLARGPAMRRLRSIRTRARIGFPVFNSGVIVFPGRNDLARRFRELTVAVLESGDLDDAVKRPFADQMALACLALEHPECVTDLPEHWNCAINAPAERATLWHYFSFTRLATTPEGRATIFSLQDEYEQYGINLLGEWSRRDVMHTTRPERRFAKGPAPRSRRLRLA